MVRMNARERESEHHLHRGRYRCSLPAAQHVTKEKKKLTETNGSRMTRGDRRVKRKARARRLADTLLWALGVEGQGDMAQILDVEGGGLG